jgi:DNA polymerase III epsilon subunit-like protein
LDFIARQCRGGGTPVLVAHNGRRFDVPFLSNELKRSNLELPAHCAFIDTYVLCRVRSAMHCPVAASSSITELLHCMPCAAEPHNGSAS